jgi:hypothetical protein
MNSSILCTVYYNTFFRIEYGAVHYNTFFRTGQCYNEQLHTLYCLSHVIEEARENEMGSVCRIHGRGKTDVQM